MDLICINRNSLFYIDLHGNRNTFARPWAILEMTKFGPKLFDIYRTKEDAERAAKTFDIKISEKSEISA